MYENILLCLYKKCLINLEQFQGESFEPSTQKSTAPRKHGMQSLGKVPTARRPPANLPSLKAEVGNPGEQSGSWTNELNEGQYVSQSPNHSTEEVNKIPNLSISKSSTQRHTSSPNISKPGELSWNTVVQMIKQYF